MSKIICKIFFASSPTDEPFPAKAAISEPTVATAAFEPSLKSEPGSSKPAPSEPVHAESDAPKAF